MAWYATKDTSDQQPSLSLLAGSQLDVNKNGQNV